MSLMEFRNGWIEEWMDMGMQCINSVVPWSRFLGDTGSPYLNFKGTFAKSGGHTNPIVNVVGVNLFMVIFCCP